MIHMIVQFGDERPEDKIRALLGPLADFCDIIICSNTIAYRNKEITSATLVHYGVVTIKRSVNPGGAFSIRAPFHPLLAFDMSTLLSALEQTSLPEERILIGQSHFERSESSKILSGTGARMRIVNFLVYCYAIVRRALPVRSYVRSAWRFLGSAHRVL